MEVLTDFSELWRLQGRAAAEPLLPEPEVDYTVGLVRHRTERVEHTVSVPRWIGRHRLPDEVRTIVVYRTVKP